MNAHEWLETAREWGLCVEATYADGDTALFVLESDVWARMGSEPEGPVTASAVMNAIQACDPDVRLRGMNAVDELDDSRIETVDS